ncbi:molybdenum cofactor biosynthesis protein B [Deinococcus metalli]|uniref:Molybdenum cofactor biosynthesis protein B n=1 Tax=Deinococcus metalli TaxID=1141878 RepID=A0A7W8NMH4_9DEIO|nr:MogA/MoaB family molybdenum cofactor biosynthesis protein [Deinococcus metalli]MBB5374691.1 molybdenum cofactor biosynthesis protein B [Deinococcus metalli]
MALVTISDTRTPETDTSGQYLMTELRAAGHELVGYRIVKDDAVEIRAALVQFSREAQIVLSSGGTGITGRDVTVPVVESILTKPIPGFGELFRMLSYQQVGGAAMLSRAVGGLCRGAAVFAMPGSLNAVKTAWEGILRDELPHLVFELERHGQPGVMPTGTEALPAEAAPTLPGRVTLERLPLAPLPGGFPAAGTGGGAAAGLGRHKKGEGLP